MSTTNPDPVAGVREIRERVDRFKTQYSPGPDWEPFNQMYQDCATLLRVVEELWGALEAEQAAHTDQRTLNHRLLIELAGHRASRGAP